MFSFVLFFVFAFTFGSFLQEATCQKYLCPPERIKELDTVTGRVISLDDRYQRKFPQTVEEIPKYCL